MSHFLESREWVLTPISSEGSSESAVRAVNVRWIFSNVDFLWGELCPECALRRFVVCEHLADVCGLSP